MAGFSGIVPAAGKGDRCGGGLAKQFRALAGRPMVVHAVGALLADPRLTMVHVVYAPDSAGVPVADFPAGWRGRVAVSHLGGADRAATVTAMVAQLAQAGDDWMVVHDAARPCLHRDDLAAVLDVAEQSGQPALLAERLAATLKQAEDGCAAGTIERADKWLAQTPQVVKAQLLHSSLTRFPQVTDEAQALELAGHRPRLVEARHPNPKVTTAADLRMAGFILDTGPAIS